MTNSTAEAGRDLEQRIATYFESHGYSVKTNVVLEGRSGGRHEIDVLATRSDALVTYRVAVECKAWQTPIEKDVISKLHYVMSDLGLNKGMVVSLGGARSGADRTAQDLGIDIWGPDELRLHLGAAAVAAAGTGPTATATAHGFAFSTTAEGAAKVIAAQGKGRFGLRTLESSSQVRAVWLPAYVVGLTVARPEERKLRGTRMAAHQVTNLYDALGGGLVNHAGTSWVSVDPASALRMAPLLKEARLHAGLHKSVIEALKVSSAAAVARHTAHLQALGLPGTCRTISVDRSNAVLLPYYVGLLEAKTSSRRALAVDGVSGQLNVRVSDLLTRNISHLLSAT